MAISDKFRVPSTGGSNRLLALFVAAAFIILAGVLAPNLLNLQPLTTTSATAEGARPAGADAVVPASAAGEAAVTVSRRTLEKLGVGAVAVVLLGVIIAWMIRNWMKTRTIGPYPLNVTAALPLPHRCCLFLLETGDRRFLAGVDANGIQSFLSIPPETDDARVEAESLERPHIAGALATVESDEAASIGTFADRLG
jgi:flagellar biogenesis protein FliO